MQFSKLPRNNGRKQWLKIVVGMEEAFWQKKST